MSSKLIEQFPDNNGLLWNYHLDGTGGGRQQADLGNTKKTKAAFDWVHLRSNEPETINWMVENGLSSQIIEMMNAPNTRPRMQKLDGGILINLRGVNTNPGADPEDMVALRIWFTNDTIITTRSRNRKLLSIEDLRETIESKTGPATTGEFVCMLIKYIANRIGDVVDDIDEALSKVETNLSEDNINQVQHQLFSTRTKSAAIRRYLAPQREALTELCRSRGIFSDTEMHELQFQTDRVTHYVEEIDLARERAQLLQSDLQNRLTEKQNARMYLLSIVTAIFLPLSFLTGIFGMNVAGLPGIENPMAFLYLSAAMLVLAICLLAFMRWKRWL